MLSACLLAVHFERGFWVAATVAMVVEPGLGASLRNCALRLQGSVVGACFGFTALALTAQAEALPRDALLVTASSLWTFGCAFVRAGSAAARRVRIAGAARRSPRPRRAARHAQTDRIDE